MSSSSSTSSSPDSSLANNVASACYRAFSCLPKKVLPQVGVEWALLAGFVMSSSPLHSPDTEFVAVALGTGSKCLGKSQLCHQGKRVSDSHAEVVARRSFRRFLLQEIYSVLSGGHSVVFYNESCEKSVECTKCTTIGAHNLLPLSLKPHVRFYFFTSHTPCGDCSIFAKRPRENNRLDNGAFSVDESEVRPAKLMRVDITDIHRTGAKPVEGETSDLHLPGADYHVTGVLRNKPGRGEPTLSHCCSDKLARWLAMGIEGALLAPLLLEPIRVKAIVIGAGACSIDALRRGLLERIPLATPQDERPLILQSQLEFCWGRNYLENQQNGSAVDGKDQPRLVPSPCSVVWCLNAAPQLQILVEGWLQGCTKKQRAAGVACASISRSYWSSEFLKFLRNVPRDSLPNDYQQLLQESEANDSYADITYSQLKSASKEYNNRWKHLRKLSFANWMEKPTNLKSFVIPIK